MANNFLLITYGDGLGLAHRLMLEGNKVKVFFPKAKLGADYNGMAERVDAINDGLAGTDYVISDMRGEEPLIEKIEDAGYPVIGSSGAKDKGNYIFDQIETDRVYAIEVMRQHGIPVPETHYFDNAKEAVNFLDTKGGADRWVAKPLCEVPKSMTIVAKDNNSLKSDLEGWTADPKTKSVKLVLQKFIKGLEVNPEIYFSRGNPVLPATVLFEDKKFMNDDIGPAVGVAASTVFPYYGTRLIDQTIKKLYPFVKKTGYTGPVDCNVILTDKGEPFFLEAGWRFGWSSTYAELALLGIPFGEFVAGLCEGKLKTAPWWRGYAGSLRVSIPPYPFECVDDNLRDKVYEQAAGITLPDDPFKDLNTFPVEIYKEDGKYKTMGLYGVVCEIAGFNPSLEQMWKQIYGKAEKLTLPDKQYRTDAVKVKERIDKFFSLGYGRTI